MFSIAAKEHSPQLRRQSPADFQPKRRFSPAFHRRPRFYDVFRRVLYPESNRVPVSRTPRRNTLTRSASGECVTAGCTAYRDTVALWVENPSEHIIEARAAMECRGESTLRLEVCRGLAAQLGAVFFCGNGEHGGVRRGIRLPVAS